MARGSSLKITCKGADYYATKDITGEFKKEEIDVVEDFIEYEVGSCLINNIKAPVRQKALTLILTGAIFFQRLIARTPLDEDYDWTYITKEGEARTRHHKADNCKLRGEWICECAGKRITGYELMNQGIEFYNVYSPGTSEDDDVMRVFEAFYRTFRGVSASHLSFKFINNSPYFEKVEYGWYQTESSDSKAGDLYYHGLKQHHSVQAPKGMLRLTMLEFQAAALQDTAESIAIRYLGTENTGSGISWLPKSDDAYWAKIMRQAGHKGVTVKNINNVLKNLTIDKV